MSFITWFIGCIFFAFTSIFVITLLQKKEIFFKDTYTGNTDAFALRVISCILSLIWPFSVPTIIGIAISIAAFYVLYLAANKLADKILSKFDKKEKEGE